MYQFEETGGAMYGMINASWPFANLKVTRNKLELNISMFAKLQFRPVDVISVTPFSQGPFSKGIRINHNVNGYKSSVVFKSRSNNLKLIKEIEQTGFLSNKDPLPVYDDIAITTMQSTGGFAMKKSAAIIIVVIWNALFLVNIFGIFKSGKPEMIFGLGAKMALGFMVALSVGLIVSDFVRNIVLKENRTFDEIKIFTYFLLLISTFMLIVFCLVPK